MNDRFKFRVWNQTEMHYNDFVVTATGYVGKITEEFLGQVVFKQDDLTTDNECTLMQCIGLKDKNGKLIYEGDIVKQGDAKYVVNWLEGTFCFKGLKTLHNFTIEYVMPSKQEVIGNIYENKDLLNENS